MESCSRIILACIVHLCAVSYGAVITGTSVSMESSTNSPAEHTTVEDTKLSIGHWIFFGVLILLLMLLIILTVILSRSKIANARKRTRPPANQQPIDLLTANQQFQREDRIYSITDERADSSGYALVYTAIPDQNGFGSTFPSTYGNSNSANQTSTAACNDLHRGRKTHFGFLQYANANEAVSKNHHPEHNAADSALNNPNVLLGNQQETSNAYPGNLVTQPTCVVNETVIVGADGTQYLRMNDVNSLVQTPTSVPPRNPGTQSAFATSTYAHIDHSFKVSPSEGDSTNPKETTKSDAEFLSFL